MYRRIIVILLLCWAGRTTAAGFADEISTTVDLAWISEHVVRGVDRAGSAAQIAVGAGTERWRARIASTAPFDSGEATEWNVAGSWNPELSDKFSLRAGVHWTRFGRGGNQPGHDLLEFSVRGEWSLPRETKVSVLVGHDVEIETTTGEAGLEHSFALARWGAYLDCRFFVGWSDGRDWRRHAGARVRDAYGYWGAAAELPYRIGGNTSIVAGAEYSAVWNHREASSFPGPHGRRNLVGRIGVRFDF